MKKSLLIVLWLILWIILLIILFISDKYNTMVWLDESTKTARAQVENVYQRRFDLIPNLVNTVKWIASQEEQVFIWVTNARAAATKVNINIDDVQEFSNFQKSQTELSSALSRLLMVTENYPDLKSNQNFLELQSQLEWTENRIAVERKTFNETAKSYNIYIRRVPNNLIASILWFKQRELFEASEWAEIAPVVDFAPAFQE